MYTVYECAQKKIFLPRPVFVNFFTCWQMVKTFGQKNDFIKEHIFSTPSLAMRAYQDLTHRAPPPLITEKGQTIAILHTRTDLQQRFFTI